MVSPLEVEEIGKKQSLTDPIPFTLLPCQASKLKFEPIQQYTVQRLHGISEVYRKWDIAWAIASCIRVDSPCICTNMSVHEVVHSSEPETELGPSSSIIIGTDDLET